MIDKGLYKDKQKKVKYYVQGGVRNYLGKQKTVSDIPIKWKSGPSHPETELAYITKAEKKLLIKKDLHKSLKDGPNKGPGGIMSLNSQGDMGGSEDKGTNADGSNNSGYDAQADMTDYATNVGKTAKSKGGFKGGFGDAVSKTLGFAKNVFDKTLVGRAINTLGKLGPPKSKDTVEMYGPEGKRSGPMAPGRDITPSNNRDRDGDDGAKNNLGIMAVKEVVPIAEDEDEKNNQIAKNYDFNYGTASNPVLYSDLI